ncbi:hypothetical protein [Anaerotalea alkaliphila]|uniref:D-glucuronyl C5-epimerase C-terminal domain-containing protein n=1 Tax=Anaerotalea alkaliphila TaxID=2662126 RepID=A0A7X5KLV2_9FIRM|nr:hypothetical protein [Anaerotalea alkaliphila]NDL67246.1 hypothetical protein [Anaerotalea alkaliphila]
MKLRSGLGSAFGLGLASLLFALLLHRSVWAAGPDMELEPEPDYALEVLEESARFGQVETLQRNVSYGGRGFFFVRRVDFQAPIPYTTSFVLPGREGTLSFFRADGSLVVRPLAPGPLPGDGPLFLETAEYNLFLGQPYLYRDLGRGTIQAAEGGSGITLQRQGDGWLVTVSLQPEGQSGVRFLDQEHGLLYGAGSREPLLDLSDPGTAERWSRYDFTRQARLGFDGYYYKSPASYTPSGPGAYWRNPSMYLISHLVKNGDSLLDELLGASYLALGSANLNAAGFFPSLPESGWLRSNYGMEPGFFDTRFNADMLETYLLAWEKYGYGNFWATARTLGDFYLWHGTANHRTTLPVLEKGPLLLPEEGWLVEDYSMGDSSLDTHISLNHQLQAIHAFLHLYRVGGAEADLDFAVRMLLGIEHTRDRWVMGDGNLEYAILPDGSMGYEDYSTLTYNDLVRVQAVFGQLFGKRNPALDMLMGHKRLWMDRNGISDYLGFGE